MGLTYPSIRAKFLYQGVCHLVGINYPIAVCNAITGWHCNSCLKECLTCKGVYISVEYLRISIVRFYLSNVSYLRTSARSVLANGASEEDWQHYTSFLTCQTMHADELQGEWTCFAASKHSVCSSSPCLSHLLIVNQSTMSARKTHLPDDPNFHYKHAWKEIELQPRVSIILSEKVSIA